MDAKGSGGLDDSKFLVYFFTKLEVTVSYGETGHLLRYDQKCVLKYMK
jgi:hypothetical protein